MKTILFILACFCAIAMFAPKPADAADGKWVTAGEYTLGMVSSDSPMPFAGAWHGTSTPIVAAYVKDGKLLVQLTEGKWGQTLTFDELIRAVRQNESPFKSAGWIRGGCAGGQCGAPAVEAPVVTNMPDQSVCVKDCHPVARGVVAVAKLPVEAVENSRARRQARGGWYLGKHLRGGCCN